MREDELATAVVEHFEAAFDRPEIYLEEPYDHYGNRGVADVYVRTRPPGRVEYLAELKADPAVRMAAGANEILRQYRRMERYFYEDEAHDLRTRLGREGPGVHLLLLFAPTPRCVEHVFEHRRLYGSIDPDLTVDGVPAALSYVDGEVRYCEPTGTSPAVTDVLADRGASHVRPESASLILVGFGSSSLPFNRQAVEYHAARLRRLSDFGEVVSAFLLQNPTVDCARYNVTNDEAVAVPLFVPRSTATDVRVPEELELHRGGIEYADPLGDHPKVTEAVYAEFCKQRALSGGETKATFEGTLAATCRPMAADGEGLPE